MKVKLITINICEACLNGEGEECHTPGCALCWHTVDLPIAPELYTVLDEYEDDTMKIKNDGKGVLEWSLMGF